MIRDVFVTWSEMSDKVLAGEALTRLDALAVLQSPDGDLRDVVEAAFKVRLKHHGLRVNLHVLRNAKSGLCSEDCSFCSQTLRAESGVERYRMQTVGEIVEGAREAVKLGAVKYCVVASGRAPSAGDLDVVCEAAAAIKKEMRIHLCVSLGLLTPDQARRLSASGVDRYNHNLETSRRFFPSICTTHSYDDRIATVRAARAAGLEACCGGIVGLGETLEDRVDWAFTLRELEVEAIPVNFFNPRPGTGLSDLASPSPGDGLRALAMVRLVNPARDIRAAGGREACLGDLQPLALYLANSIFTNGYLTTPGQGYSADLEMVKGAGFEVGVIET